MDAVTFLEQLATQAHYRNEVNELISKQSENIQNAFKQNDAGLLRKQVSAQEIFADKTGVVQN